MFLPLIVLTSAPCLAVDSFSFIHTSDQHVPYSNTEDVMREMGGVGEVELAPYGITAPQPSFIIATGDATEFGAGSGWWDDYIGILDETGLPHYTVAGNHDNTWHSCRPSLTSRHGAPYYSFDHGGVHFVGLDSASPQDPRPCFGREELMWLKGDLARIDATTPVVLFYHHPPTTEYASTYDRYRLYDILRPYNVLVILMGHGHGFRHQQEEGFDFVMGGSTFGDNAGFSICDIRDGMLRIAYRKSGQVSAEFPVLEKPIAERSAYPRITIEQPTPGSVVPGTVRFEGTVEGDFTAAQIILDDDTIFPLEVEDGCFAGEVEFGNGITGAHWYRVGFRGPGGTAWHGGDFVIDNDPGAAIAWRTMLGGSSKSTPLAIGDQVILGADDGRIYSLDAATGHIRWTVETGGDVLGAPVAVSYDSGPTMGLMWRGAVFVGSGDGKLYRVTLDGDVTGTADIGAPIASPSVQAGNAVIVATMAGTVHAVDAESLDELWRSDAPEYAIEDTLFVAGDVVCFGAWDTYAYALNATTGELLWRSAASGARDMAAERYYSPADCGPVVCGDRVYIADRNYHLSVMDLATGDLVDSRKGVSGTGISEDGQSVYVRTTKSGIVKLAADGGERWSADVPTGFVAAAPIERDGVLYSVSTLGTLSAIDAESGEVNWSLDVLPGFFAMADPAIRNGVVYVAGMDGSVTAVRER